MAVSEAAEHGVDARPLAIARLSVGLIQGLALYLLYSAYDQMAWPATSGYWFAPLALVSVFIPLLLIQALGNVRFIVLVAWMAVATVVVVALAWYDIWHDWPFQYIWRNGKYETTGNILPSFGVIFFTAAGLFIAQALVAGGDQDRRSVASYPTHFDVAWKQGLQVALSAVFVGAFWLLLWLGAELFQLIKLDFLEKLIDHRWFAIPVTTLATAVAFHVTDVRAGLVRGARTLILILLSWLLPLMALFAVGFLIALIFTGPEPLWNTHAAAALLLAAAGALVVLINATYQDGDSERHTPPAVLKLAVRVSSFALIPIVALAAYAISLRVHQYGWTLDRVSSVAVTLVAAGYAAGYALAAFRSSPWMKRIERWNFLMALVVLGVLAGLFSPLADPARIAVNSQVGRLVSGKVPADKFDFGFLRYQGGRFGYDALMRLDRSASGLDAQRIRRAIADLLKKPSVSAGPTEAKGARDIATNIVGVYPKGRSLPESLLKQHWVWASNVPDCLLYRQSRCEAYLGDLDGDGKDEIVFASPMVADRLGPAQVLAEQPDGSWKPVGSLNEPPCGGALAAMRAGNFGHASPGSRWHNVMAGDAEMRFTPNEPPPVACVDK